MQFRPPSQPGWGPSEPEPDQQEQFSQWQQQPSMYVPIPPQQSPRPFMPQLQSPDQPYTQPEKYYPPSPHPPQRPEQPQRKRPSQQMIQQQNKHDLSVIGFIVAVFLFIALVSGVAHVIQSSNASSAIQQVTTSDQPTSAPQSTTFQIGELVSVGVWNVSVNSVKTSRSGVYTQPKSGDIFLVFDVTVNNTSSNPQFVSSGALFILKDDTGQSYDEQVTGIGTLLDGTVQSGDKLRGQISYEIPSNLHSFTFEFQDSTYLGNAATWDISV